MILIISGIHKIFFTLWFAVVAVRHHKIPVHFFFFLDVPAVKGVFTLSHVFYDDRSGT